MINSGSRLGLVLVGVAALTIPGTAFAQDEGLGDEGFYVSVSAGATFPSDSDIEGELLEIPDGITPEITREVDLTRENDTGYYVRGSIGYEFENGFIADFLVPRIELDLEFNESDVTELIDNGSVEAGFGDVSQISARIAIYNDIRWSEDQTIIPYFGGGIGIASTDRDFQLVTGNGIFNVDESSSGFSHHNALGARFELGAGTSVYLEGRYTSNSSSDFDARFTAITIPGAQVDPVDAELEGDNDGFSLGAGLRIKL